MCALKLSSFITVASVQALLMEATSQMMGAQLDPNKCFSLKHKVHFSSCLAQTGAAYCSNDQHLPTNVVGKVRDTGLRLCNFCLPACLVVLETD